MKLKIMILCLFFIALLGCQPKEEVLTFTDEDHVLNWSVAYMPNKFYPSMTLSDEEKQIVSNLYEGLMRYEDGKVVYGSAENIDLRTDGLVYDVKLKNTQWSDGKPVTTDDFIYSWEREENYKDDHNLLYLASGIRDVIPVDDQRMLIYLNRKNDLFLEQLSKVAFMPLRRDVIDINKSIPTLTSDVTNGPYSISNYGDVEGFVLKKNMNYHEAYNVSIELINVDYNNNPTSVYTSYQNGDTDVIQTLDHQELYTHLQLDEGFNLSNKNGVYGLAINANREAFFDVRIRQLLNIAIDRSEINPYIDILSDSNALSVFDYEWLKAFNPEDDSFYLDIKPYIDVDDINHTELALATGQIDALDGAIITTLNTSNDIRIAESLQVAWREHLGVQVLIQPMDHYDFYYALGHNDYDMIVYPVFYEPNNIKSILNQFVTDTAINKSAYHSMKYDELFLQIHDQEDADLYETYKSMIKLLDDSYKLIPLFKIYDASIVSEYVVGWSRNYEGYIYFGRAVKLKREDNQ